MPLRGGPGRGYLVPSGVAGSMGEAEEDWTHALFVENPHLFLPFLEAAVERAGEEAEGMARIFEAQGVPAGGHLLDLSCGIGRHSVALAKRGFRVTGVDLSPVFLERARATAEAEGVGDRTEFVRGDFRTLSGALGERGPFDGALNAFTSHGYYGEEVDRRAFAALAALTVEGGPLIVETANRDWIERHFEPIGWQEAGEVLLRESREYDARRSYMVNEWVFYTRRGEDWAFDTRLTVDHRLYGPDDLTSMLESAGWSVASVYGNFGRDPLRAPPEKNRIVLVAERSTP